ncbi:MAG: transcription-repair coupling factor [Cyclobacteriaceae bacterium]
MSIDKHLLTPISESEEFLLFKQQLQSYELPIRLSGVSGSYDTILCQLLKTELHAPQVVVLQDREEAVFFQDDLKKVGCEKTLLFPSSYKKAYKLEEIENANVLERIETLNTVRQDEQKNWIILTYPDALTEKVVNKQSLVQHTLSAKVGDKLDVSFMSEMLIEYQFEKADFVYEAGQYAIRGGIIDVFSFAHEYPFRIELFDDEIESIRLFNPETQLSFDPQEYVSIVPNVQQQFLRETRESFFSYLPEDAIVWHKDLESTLTTVDQYFEEATNTFDELTKVMGINGLVTDPLALFESKKTFKASLTQRTIEFGSRKYHKAVHPITFKVAPQPSFNKNFDLLTETFEEYHAKGYELFICSDSEHQILRINTIFEEQQANFTYEGLRFSLKEGFVDHTTRRTCFTDHQIFERFHGHQKKKQFSKSKILTLKELNSLNPGDYITHIDHGVGRFAGLEKVDINGSEQEAIRIIYKDDDVLLTNIHSLHKIARYSSKDAVPPKMSKLGTPEWEKKKSKVKKQVKEIAIDLIGLYAKRKAAQGFQFSKDGFLQAELESSFIYQETPDQAKAVDAVKADMELVNPMDRLVCGDVGFGKTEVAIRAAFKAACDGKQVAVLVPTTILAMQHYKSFKKRMKNLPVEVDYLNRFRTTKETKDILARTKSSEINILIGTHKILSKSVEYKDLGLLIVDEEQKFGVAAKEKMKELRVNVDVLTLTATPIPRTLQFSLMGARDLSIIQTPPPNRQPVTTSVHTFDVGIIRDAISSELKRGGQVFMVHNRIKDIDSIANTVLKLVPDAKIAVAHGQMDGAKLEKVMVDFIDGEYDVLVSTNIIESGLDVPNANTIIINHSHMYGLSDLHQMRGRVGRSNRKAYCYLLSPPLMTLTADSRKRLETLEQFSDLGDGFKVAMRDLDIRGAGNLLGGEQSGFITDIGFDTYHKLLEETIQELKETEFKELFEKPMDLSTVLSDCLIETDMDMLIPETYVSNISERLSLYNELDNLENDAELEKFQKEVIDRFGPLPPEVKELLETVQLRWLAERLGFERLSMKKSVLRCYVSTEGNDAYFQTDVFGRILHYVQKNPRKIAIKDHKGKMIIRAENIEDIQQAIVMLRNIVGVEEKVEK